MTQKTWFITGASRGFGLQWATAALERGDRVAATARTVADLDGLKDRFGDAVLPLQLNVDEKASVDIAVRRAHEHFGRLDVVVNNAGYGHFGFVEETNEADARAQFETNFFGALWVTQAVLPILRGQGGGHILQVSSVLGVITAPALGLYNASKWALEGLSESLAAEVAAFGISVTLIEPGSFSTDWAGASAIRSSPIEAYAPLAQAIAEQQQQYLPAPGDPEATAAAVLELVDAEEPPLRVLFGNGFLEVIEGQLNGRLEQWKQWSQLSVRAQG